MTLPFINRDGNEGGDGASGEPVKTDINCNGGGIKVSTSIMSKSRPNLVFSSSSSWFKGCNRGVNGDEGLAVDVGDAPAFLVFFLGLFGGGFGTGVPSAAVAVKAGALRFRGLAGAGFKTTFVCPELLEEG